MTYYAVTDDPNELMHFGIKGMKWGVIRTPEQLGHYKTSKPRRQRSAAYNRAAAKLSRGMQRGIAKAQANWKEYNSPKNKAIRTYKRNEKRFERHVELARQGRLKYKGISDAEVRRITDRLALENRARQQSGNEKQSFARRMKSSVQEGMIEGVGRGTSSYINERMQGRGRTTAEIKGNRHKTRAQYTPVGMGNRALESHIKTADAKAEAKRQNKKAEIQAQYNDKKERRANEEKYAALVSGNQTVGYDSVYEGGRKLEYRNGRREIRRLSDAELKARITDLEDTKKLYGTVQDSRVKAKNGTVTETRLDENGNEYTVTYSNGKQQKNSNNAATVRPHASPTKSENKHYYLVSPDQKRTIIKPGKKKNYTVSQDDRNKSKEALNIEKPTKVEDETARYRKGMAQLAVEADARNKKRAQEEGFAYYEARRQSRENSWEEKEQRANEKSQRLLYEQQKQQRLQSEEQRKAEERARRAQQAQIRQAAQRARDAQQQENDRLEGQRNLAMLNYDREAERSARLASVQRQQSRMVNNRLGNGEVYSRTSSVTQQVQSWTRKKSNKRRGNKNDLFSVSKG